MLIARDERLARQAAAGDDGAFTLLYRRHHPALLRYCRSITGNEHDALDALQSAALKALLALRRGGCNGQVRPWLFRIAHNESVSLLRRRGSAATVALQDDDVAVGDVADTAAEREAFGMLVADLHALTDHQRSALVLRELSGLEYGEIAVALDTSPLAARQAVFAARSALHESRAARDLTCVTVKRTLSDGASRRGVRMHLRGCDDCRSFAREIRRRSSRMGLLVPVSPLSAAVVLQTVLGGGSAAVTAGTAGGVVAGGGAAFGGPSLAKAAAAALATVAAAGSVEQVVVERPKERVKQERAQAQERAAVDADDAPPARAAAAAEPADVQLAAAPLPAATERAAANTTTKRAAEQVDAHARDEDAAAERPADARHREEEREARDGADEPWDDDEPALADDDRAWSDGHDGHGGHGGHGGRPQPAAPAGQPTQQHHPQAHPYAQAARGRRPWRQQAHQATAPQPSPEPAAPVAPETTTTPTTEPEPEPQPATTPAAPVDPSPEPTTTTPADPAPPEPAVADPA